MNFQSRGAAEEQFQIAPMIDIVFILLVFFVVTYAVAREERLLSVRLPEAQAAQPEKRSQEEIMVNLNAGGVIVVNRQVLTPEALESRLRKLSSFLEDPGVIIRADGACAHEHVVRVMDICARNDVPRVYFSAVRTGKDGAK